MVLDRVLHPAHLGIQSLKLHKLRSGLTVLGVIFGVASVIVMLAIGEGVRHDAVQKIQELGATNIILRSVPPGSGSTIATEGAGATKYGLTDADVNLLATTIPTVRQVIPMRDHHRMARYRERELQARVVGVTASYQDLTGLRLRDGRFLTELDNQRSNTNAVLGAFTADTLFPYESPVGASIRIGEDQYYTVVGVLQPRATSPSVGTGLPAQDFNTDVYIPFSTDRKRFGETIQMDRTGSRPPEKLEVRQIVVSVADTKDVKMTANIIESSLAHHQSRNDTMMTVPLDLLEKAEQTQRMFTLVLSCIASISLIVGGIGIMNIMLATVTERTKEIGLRRALGARRADILSQFLIEAVLLTSAGGLLGIALGLGMSHTVNYLTAVPTLIRLWSPVLALGISIAVGIIFGLYPARRAACMEPIEALRHE